MDRRGSEIMRFGVFELESASGELRRQGRRVPLAEKPRQVLEALVEAPGRVVTREALTARLWADGTHVDFDANLNAAVKTLREALGDRATHARFVETVPRRGYRFVAPVERVGGPRNGSQNPARELPAGEARSGSTPEPSSQHSPAARPFDRRGQRLVALAVSLLAAAAAASWLLRSGGTEVSGFPADARPVAPATSVETGRRVLLVLPFENLDPSPERDFFADGLTDELISQLGGLRPERLGVIARTSARAYAESGATVAEIARRSGVDLVLEGSVRSDDPDSPSRLRIHARLIDAAAETPLWTRSWEPSLGAVLPAQREIGVEVARALSLELLPGDYEALARSATASAEAYEAYLRGRQAWYRFDAPGLETAVEHYEHALELDPSFAHAEAGLAEAQNLLAGYQGPQGERFELAREAAHRALALEPNLAEAHNALGYTRLYHDRDFEAAESSFERALELAPNFAMAHHWATGLYSALGRHEEALAAGHRARDLDPESLSVRSDLGWYYLFAGRPAGAVRECERTLESDPNYGWAVSCLVEAHAAAGRWPSARDAVLRRLRLDSIDAEALEKLRGTPAREAVRRYRVRTSARQRAALERGEGWAFGAAGTAALLGLVDESLALLEQAYAEQDIWLVFLGVHPAFRSLHGDPRFADILRRIGLPAADSR